MDRYQVYALLNSEVLKAFAEGETIQYRPGHNANDWVDLDNKVAIEKVIRFPERYRVKTSNCGCLDCLYYRAGEVVTIGGRVYRLLPS